MSSKHVASGSPGAAKPKKCRKYITLDTKLEIFNKSDEDTWLKDTANLFNLATSSAVTIKKDKDKTK